MPELVDRVRAFNRGWTEVLGLLDEGLLATEHTLAEARVIFELAQRPSGLRSGGARPLNAGRERNRLSSALDFSDPSARVRKRGRSPQQLHVDLGWFQSGEEQPDRTRPAGGSRAIRRPERVHRK